MKSLKNTEQIPDHQGNMFHPTRDQRELHLAGWRCVKRKKMGCMWIVQWFDNDGGMVWSQGTAIQILRDRRKSLAKKSVQCSPTEFGN